MTAYIYNTDIEFIKNNILDLNIEICGNILNRDKYKQMYKNTEYENIYDHYVSSRGILWYDVKQTENNENNNRLSCDHTIGSNIMFHTHPNISKFYPSKEDIIKYIFSKEQQTNLIFTSLGIWEFKPKSNHMYNIRKQDERKYEILKRKFLILIEKELTKIYRNTYKGRKENIPENNLVNTKTYLKDFFRKELYEKYFNIIIRFTPWDEINNHYLIF